MTDAPGQPQELAREVLWRAGKPALEAVLTLPGGPGPPRACLVLAHGAGGDMHSGHLPRLAQALARGGVGVVRFTHRCTHLPTRVDAYRAVLSAAQGWPETRGTRAWVCAGHSMGSRAACAVAHEASGAEGGSGGPAAAAGSAATRTGRSGKVPAAAAAAAAAEAPAEAGERVRAPTRKRRKGADADAPAPPAGEQKRGEAGDAEEAEARPAETELRDTPLASLSLPLLFVRGSRDEFSTPGPWEEILGRMSSSDLRVHTVEGGDHGLAAPGGRAAAEAALAEALEAVVAFVQELAARA